MLVFKTYKEVKPHSSEESEDKVVREREISMTMINMYIISSCKQHLQEAVDGMGDGVGWLGGRWGVNLYFLSIVKFLVKAASAGVGDCPDISIGIETK